MEGNAIVSELLGGDENYGVWRVQMKNYLLGRDLWEVVEADANETQLGQSDDHVKAWRKMDALALHAILISCNKQVVSMIRESSSAKAAWTALENAFRPNPAGSADENNNPNEEERRNEIEENSTSNEIEGATQSNMGPTTWSVPNLTTETFFKAVTSGDWDTTLMFLCEDRSLLSARVPDSGKTALHVAIAEEHLHIVERLVYFMSPEEMLVTWGNSSTGLADAIEIGNTSIAQCLIGKNSDLIRIEHQTFGIPVVHAATLGRWKMLPYLYDLTPPEDLISLNGGLFGVSLICLCIYWEQLDIPLRLLKRAPMLAFTEHDRFGSPVVVLARANVFRSGCSLKFWQKWIYDWTLIPDFDSSMTDTYLDIQDGTYNRSHKRGINISCSSVFCCLPKVFSSLRRWTVSNLHKLWLNNAHVRSVELLSLVRNVIENTPDEKIIIQVRRALLQAARKGNIEFFMSLVNAKPKILCDEYDDITRMVIEAAIELRSVKIFRLVYGLQDSVKKSYHNNFNTLLHQAALVAPARVLNRTPGAAMRMELQWFKVVESITSPIDRQMTNVDHMTPRDLFTESHKDLVIAGEKWIKETANSCTFISALIITATVAAAFTVPGGYNQNSGFPIFADRKLFQLFTLFNTAALFLSTTSALMFLGILIARYKEEDFQISLDLKLIIGLQTLFYSVVAVMFAFCAGLSLMLHPQEIGGPSVFFAIISVVLFVGHLFL